jgi:hypothetical protein
VGTSLYLWDAGWGPSASEWPGFWQSTLTRMRVEFEPLGAPPNAANIAFSRDLVLGMDFSVDRANACLAAPWDCITREVCTVLFGLANEARLFILVFDAPEFLRPPSLSGLDFDRGSTRLSDVEDAKSFYHYLFPET